MINYKPIGINALVLITSKLIEIKQNTVELQFFEAQFFKICDNSKLYHGPVIFYYIFIVKKTPKYEGPRSSGKIAE